MSFTIHASSLARLMKCAGHIKFTDIPNPPQSEAAAEGTAAGEYLAALVEGKIPPAKASNGVEFDVEMAEHAENARKHFTPRTLCEQSSTWQSEHGPTVSCRSDMVHDDEGDTLHLIDYKYGYTVVEEFENWQLLSYAIGETMKRGKLYAQYNLSILQPRAHHGDGPFRTWVITGEQLTEYKAKIEARIKQVLDGDESLVTGSHCKYCKVAEAGRCGAFNKAAVNALEVITEKQIDVHLTDEQIAREYEVFSRISDLLDIKLKSLSDLLKERLQAGHAVGDYTLSPTGGRRAWKDGLTPDSISMMTGINKDLLCNLISPAQFEKMIGKQADLMANLTFKQGGGFKITKGKTTKQLAKSFAGLKGE